MAVGQAVYHVEGGPQWPASGPGAEWLMEEMALHPTADSGSSCGFERVLLWVTVAAALAVVLLAWVRQPATFYVSEREPQTAITAYYMATEARGPVEAITPLMGHPWSIPMEFPLYQLLVAKLWVRSVRLDDVGRVVSLLCFLLSVLVGFRLARRVGLDGRHAYAFAVLALSSPIYLSYSLSFTIETLALLLSMLFLYLWVVFEQSRSRWLMVLAIVVGVLAALAKTTTWVVPGSLLALWLVVGVVSREEGLLGRSLARLAALAAPLAAAFAWTWYGDAVKAANGLTQVLCSSAMAAWNYGTVEQKLSAVGWLYYLCRTALTVLGGVGAAVVVVLLVRALARWERPPWSELIGVCLIAVIIGPVIFTNLHFVHDYYCMAGGFFLVLVLILGFPAGVPRFLLVLLVASNLVTSHAYLYLKQVNYDDPVNRNLISAVEDLPDDQVLVVFGSFFDAALPYRAHKRALQTEIDDFADPAFQATLEITRANAELGAVIARTPRYREIAARTAARLGLDRIFSPTRGVILHYRSSAGDAMALEELPLEGMVEERIGAFLDEVNGSGSRLVLTVGEGGRLGCALRAHGNLYLFDLENGAQILHGRRHLAPAQRVELKIEPQ
jgi:hypothetical protein